MRDFIAGTDVKIAIPLMDGAFPVVPSIGTTFFSVYDHQAEAIPTMTNVEIITDVATTAVSVMIPALQNTIASPKKFERRLISLRYEFQGSFQFQNQQYRIVPLLNHSVTVDSVREFVGLSKGELSADTVDLFAAYWQVEEDAPSISLAAQLATGTFSEMMANEAIRMRAVISILPSLKQRLAQQESNGVMMFRRANIDKLDNLERVAWDRYSAARDYITNATQTNLTFVTVTQDTDVITG